eukprot:Blabericola_migrator_1__4030@NODE_2226_length_3096_cov_10_601519_g1402_i0_p1_GENE_NODE_2226_length_3096_cov_10_601519_g1402_i0NODE_2226_length_3096_cov_10_601519_g1402_i0_p1_ORF_typecomplete_len265_score35_81SesA/PF17107_5/0_18_NODE_2226_length_3096_cov_10_601519_g1402_i013962190
MLDELTKLSAFAFKSPRIGGFLQIPQGSSGAVAASTGDSELFGKLFHVIFTTLRDTDESPTPHFASLQAAQCNEILSQHGHLLSPLVAEILKAQGEAAYKCVTESVADRSVSISEGWLSALVETVSNLVHEWWGLSEAGEEGLPARQGPVTASEVIASVNPALAGTIGHFLRSVRAALVDIPLDTQQHVALQRLFQSEHSIVDPLKRTCKSTTKSEMETKIKRNFISRVNSLWPPLSKVLIPKSPKLLTRNTPKQLRSSHRRML